MDRSMVDAKEKSTPYSVLGVPKEASTEEIRNAYKRAAWMNHPDRTKKDMSTFEEIHTAYTILSNKKNRILYNIFGENIIPILLEHKYAGYINFFVSKRVGALLSLLLVFSVFSTLLYPYLVLLVRIKVLPYYTLTLIPHFVSYSIFVGLEYGLMNIESKYNREAVVMIGEGGVYFFLSFFLLSFYDRIVSPFSVICILVVCEIVFCVLHLAKRLEGVEVVSETEVERESRRKIIKKIVRRIGKKVAKCIVEPEYLMGMIFRVAQVLVLLTKVHLLVKALPLPSFFLISLFVKKKNLALYWALFFLSILIVSLLLWIAKRKFSTVDIVGLSAVAGAEAIFLLLLSTITIRTVVNARWRRHTKLLLQ